MWIVVTRNRPGNVQRIFSMTVPVMPGIIAIDDDQVELYSKLELPDNWRVIATPPSRFGPKNNEILAMFPNEPFYGSLNDDMLPQSPGWDVDLVKAAGPWGIAWADDCLYRRIGCVAFGGELIRALGFICCPPLLHFYNDDAHELIAAELRNGKFCADIKVEHLHFTNGKVERDQTYNDRPPSINDKKAFREWKATQWPEIRDRVLKAMPAS
jgi:hypothetical protein